MVRGSTHPTIEFYGAGSAFSRRYGTTCSGLRIATGELWLIDCGRQAPDQLHAAGVSWHEIAGQLLTHVHGDHAFGLEDFAFSRFFHQERGVAPVRLGGPRPRLIAHSAVRDELWQTLAASLRWVPEPWAPGSGTLETYFDVVTPNTVESSSAYGWPIAEHYAAGALEVCTRTTLHVPGKPSTALEIGIGEREHDGVWRAWWSGDSTVDIDQLVALEPSTSVFFHDCTFTEYPGQVHGSFELLQQLPPSLRRKVVLMHHDDDVERYRDRAEELGFRLAMPGHVYDLVTGQRIA